MKNYKLAIAYIALAAFSFGAFAAGGGNTAAEGVSYIAINPPLIVNYGGPGQVRYIKAELSLRAESAADATKVTHHLPLIRDRLVAILSAQTEDVISTAEGKEYLRVYALSEINKALLKVEGLEAENGPQKERTVDGSPSSAKTSSAATQEAVASSEAVNEFPQASDVEIVKGPASDLFFNNFVVQK